MVDRDINLGGAPLRLLFVHEVNWRKKVVYEIHDYPELLSLRGHEIVFLDFPEGSDLQGLRKFLDLRTEVHRDQTRAHAGSRVEVRTPGRVLPPPLDRLTATATHVPELRRTLRERKFDAVILYAVPTNGWQTIMVAREFGVPVIFRALDVSNELRKSVFRPLIQIAENYVYRNANAVSTHNEALRQYCVQHGARAETTSIEYPGIDLERFSPAPRNPELCARYGIRPEHKVVVFMGTLYRFAGLDWFLRSFAQVLKSDPHIRLVLVGGGEKEPSLRKLARDLGLSDSVTITGFITDYAELADHLRLADVAFNTFRRSIVTDCALPGKVLQYLACGIPSVCTPLIGLQSALREGEGIVYRDLDVSFVEAIRDLLSDDEQQRRLATAARRVMEDRFRWDTCIELFEQAIRRTIKARQRLSANQAQGSKTSG